MCNSPEERVKATLIVLDKPQVKFTHRPGNWIEFESCLSEFYIKWPPDVVGIVPV